MEDIINHLTELEMAMAQSMLLKLKVQGLDLPLDLPPDLLLDLLQGGF